MKALTLSRGECVRWKFVMNENWLNTLKVGDKVIVSSSFVESIDVVERLTKTQILLKNTYKKYRRNSGVEISGDKWNFTRLYEATEEAVNKIREKNKRKILINRINSLNLYLLTTDVLEQIDSLTNDDNHNNERISGQV